jgi:hypothetical protein
MGLLLRLMFTHAPAADTWRPGFELAQAAAALDMPLELGFAGAGLELIMPRAAAIRSQPGTGVWASLALLGVEGVHAPAACRDRFVGAHSALPVRWLETDAWLEWMRRAPLTGW